MNIVRTKEQILNEKLWGVHKSIIDSHYSFKQQILEAMQEYKGMNKKDLFNAFSYYAFKSISNKPYNQKELEKEFDEWYNKNYNGL